MIAHLLGLDNPSGAWYLFWSGFGGDIGELAIIGIIWRRVNCHDRGCWRIGLHHKDNLALCSKHLKAVK